MRSNTKIVVRNDGWINSCLKSMHQTEMMDGPSEGSHKSCRDTEAARPILDHWGWFPSTGKCTSQHRSHTYRLLGVRTSRSGRAVCHRRPKGRIGANLGLLWEYSLHTIVDFHGRSGSQNADLHTGRGGYLEFYQHDNLIRSFQVFKPQSTGQMRFRSIWNREFLPSYQWTNLT
jgi:hypothetical protein